MKKILSGAALGLVIGAVGSGLAQQGSPMQQQMPMGQGMPHGQMMQGQGQGQQQHQDHASPTGAGEAEKAYRAAMTKMHKAMAIKYSGDADKDFVAGMIPHHQGAIDMAQVQLKYGKDPEIRKLAEAVVRDQTREIAEMKAWQAKTK
jgi:uncharacterized protein (DUF305 family)